MKAYKGTLAEYVMARRGLMQLSQSELADKAGLSRSEVNSLERGRILLPGADKRRRLSQALNTFHAELLVYAGEITEEEIIEGANVYDPQRARISQPFSVNSPAAKIVEILRSLPDEQAEWVLGTARFAEKKARGERDEEDLTIHVGTTRRAG